LFRYIFFGGEIRYSAFFLIAIYACLTAPGCSKSVAADNEEDAGVGDADSDGDTDTDTDTDTDSDTDAVPKAGEIGFRCTTQSSCAVELECKSDFFFERKVCTKSCGSPEECPEGTECLNDIPDLWGGLVGPFCLRPCETQPDCETILGSDCDQYEPLTQSYCF
jgi:hypothetical protein